mmetsp:Transcript_35297/g.93114  ORF Transcript_35297/g.93114 Transcript_35297/m.93114 type:complete len:221 (-) Transcript_35297:18-680(-)
MPVRSVGPRPPAAPRLASPPPTAENFSFGGSPSMTATGGAASVDDWVAAVLVGYVHGRCKFDKRRGALRQGVRAFKRASRTIRCLSIGKLSKPTTSSRRTGPYSSQPRVVASLAQVGWKLRTHAWPQWWRSGLKRTGASLWIAWQHSVHLNRLLLASSANHAPSADTSFACGVIAALRFCATLPPPQPSPPARRGTRNKQKKTNEQKKRPVLRPRPASHG